MTAEDPDWIHTFFLPDHDALEVALRNAIEGLRPSQIRHFHHVVTEQSPHTRLAIWTDLLNQSSSAPVNYVLDVLRVTTYLLKLFPDESSAGYQTLTHLYASFAAPWDRGAFEAQLVSTRHLPTLAALIHTVESTRQHVILDVAAEHPLAFETLLAWCHDRAESPNLLHSTVATVANSENFPLWMDLIVNVQPVSVLEPFLILLNAFAVAGMLDTLSRVFLGHAKPSTLVEPLVGLATQGVPLLQSLLPHLSAKSASIMICSLHPLLSSLAALAPHSVPDSDNLETTISALSRLDVSLSHANELLQFASTLSGPWPFVELVVAVAGKSPLNLTRLFHVFAGCSSTDKHNLVRLVLLDDATLDFALALLQIPMDKLTAVLAMTSTFPPSELSQLAPLLTQLDHDCLDPLLTLLNLPDLLRTHLYTILDGVDTPRRLLESLQHVWVDESGAIDRVLHVLALLESDQKCALATAVLHASDMKVNRRLLGFLATPPGEMDSREVLRLLRHVEPASYDSLLTLFQHPLRSKLELLVLSELVESVASPSSMQCLLVALVRMDESTLHAFFHYLEHVSDSLVIVDLIEVFPSAGVQLYLDLATGLSQSMLREVNSFMEGLDVSGRGAFLRVIPNPRRNILSRLIMSVHTFDHITVGNILRALEHHTWEIRSLLVEQFRILDDPTALAQLASVHESLGTDLNGRDSLETYAMVASYCSKSIQVQLAAVLYRFAPSDRGDLLMLIRNHAQWLPTEAIDAGFWTEENIARLCTVFLQRNSHDATYLLQFLRRLDSKFHEKFLHTCKDLSADMAYFVRVFHGASVANVHGLSAVLLSGDLTTVDVARLAKCVRKMLKASFGLDLAVQLLAQFPRMAQFLSYFDRLGPAQGQLVQILAEFPTHAGQVVRFLESLDMDDAVFVMRRLTELPPDSRRRFEALLEKPLTRLTGHEKAFYLSVVDGCKLLPLDTPSLLPTKTVTSRSLPELNVLWNCDDVETKLLSRKPRRVGQFPCVSIAAKERETSRTAAQVAKEFYTISMEPNREFSLSLASPLRDTAPLQETAPSHPTTSPSDVETLIDNQLGNPDFLAPAEVPPPAPDPIECVDSDEYNSDDKSDPDMAPQRLFDHVLAENTLKKHPLHTLVEEDLDADGLPRIHIPGRCKRPTARSMRGLMPAIQNNSLDPGKRRPSTSPGSPFESIGQDDHLMRWPPTRIRVARTPEAKKRVFDARVHKSMGTLMLPALNRQQDTPTIRRTKSCVGL